MKNIFLSASIPLPDSDEGYFATADIVAIRESVVALTTTTLSEHRLIWGGHPSITPLINYVMQKRKINIQEHVKLYQSRFFENEFLQENEMFEDIVLTENLGDKSKSIEVLRNQMFSENEFSAGVFIGGMAGVVDEYKMFVERFPNALIIPLASTGGAVKIIYDGLIDDKNKNLRFEKDYGYMSIFQKFLIEKL
ncbi:hypothetical protein [Pedobacter sp. UC225_65]|uniref:SLOG domain-containing protein n=1 Tax=Pedobacter sp. UC225_65 TaxID=3350173 RepID=UPI00366EA3C5